MISPVNSKCPRDRRESACAEIESERQLCEQVTSRFELDCKFTFVNQVFGRPILQIDHLLRLAEAVALEALYCRLAVHEKLQRRPLLQQLVHNHLHNQRFFDTRVRGHIPCSSARLGYYGLLLAEPRDRASKQLDYAA
ncbi:hypothetical protein F441_12439, partial [Phytophthora nicotianae CJ01A1]